MDDRPVQTMEPGPTELAVENERLQRALRGRLEEEQALRRVATLVARQHVPEAVLALVTEEVARHLHASAAATVRYDDRDHATVVATWTAPGIASFTLGRQIEIAAGTALAGAQRTRAPARVDSYEGVEGVVPQALRERGARAAVASPIFVDGHLWGAFVLASREGPFTASAEARLGAFTELVAQAIANVDARIKLQESRARIVEATYAARRRIERDLHDGAQQRLVALALSLALVARSAEPATATALARCIEELQAALAELRELARGLHPVVLTERGLVAALQSLAAQAPVLVILDAEFDGRLPPAHEAALYFVTAEALTNVAKYANASTAIVTLQVDDGWAEITIADDGVGGARTEGGSGLRGLRDRVEALGGRLTLASPAAKGTTLRARIPLAKPDSLLIASGTA